MIKINLLTAGTDYKATGKTIEEALGNLKLDYTDIKAKGIMTVKNDKDSYEHLFNIIKLRRIISNKIVRKYWAKTLGMYLKSDKKTNLPEPIKVK